MHIITYQTKTMKKEGRQPATVQYHPDQWRMVIALLKRLNYKQANEGLTYTHIYID